MHAITGVRISGPTTVELDWDDGTTSSVDFRETIEQGGVFTPMADPEVFARVELGPYGYYLTWPGELEFCADALYLSSHALTTA